MSITVQSREFRMSYVRIQFDGVYYSVELIADGGSDERNFLTQWFEAELWFEHFCNVCLAVEAKLPVEESVDSDF